MRLKQIKPKPHAVERADALPTLGRFLAATPDVELVWLSDGVDLGGGDDFVAALGTTPRAARPITVVDGGIAGARALAGADNAAGALTVKVLRATAAAPTTGTVRALDLKGLPLGDAPFTFKDGETETEAEFDAAGRDPQRHRPAGNRRRALGRRGAAARQALAPALRSAWSPASTADTAQPLLASDLLPHARARHPLPTCGSPTRLAGAGGDANSSSSACRC